MRNKEEIKNEYHRWANKATEFKNELISMTEEEMEDSFYRELEFGTGGLRGILGVGTNRMNTYTVAKATQGLSDYIKQKYPSNSSVAIAYDSRINSDVFSRTAAEVFSGNGIKVFIYPELMPTPCLSFAVRYLGCAAGIVITASHNPSKYNGYKVYGNDGCQITTEAAETIYRKIDTTDVFQDVKKISFEAGVQERLIQFIQNDCIDSFIENVKSQSVLYGDDINRDVSVVYSPLNGAGLIPVTRTLKEMGFTNIFVVPEQEKPDGHFPTCPYPNPEIREALELGLRYAKEKDADLMLATDPDSDRVGIAVKGSDGEHFLLTGNEVGILLLDYICNQRIKHNKMPKTPVFVKTIVTTDMAEAIATDYGVKTINVLTGFKFIGEQVGLLEKSGREDSYIFGFEESYGYLSGSYVRDKDAVDGSFLICEMFAYYKTRGISLLDKLEELYKKFGYRRNKLCSYRFEGVAGFEKMKGIMSEFRENKRIGSFPVTKMEDYMVGINNLPRADVLKFYLENGCTVVIRPSGTEPLIKAYISTSAETKQKAEEIEEILVKEINGLIA